MQRAMSFNDIVIMNYRYESAVKFLSPARFLHILNVCVYKQGISPSRSHYRNGSNSPTLQLSTTTTITTGDAGF